MARLGERLRALTPPVYDQMTGMELEHVLAMPALQKLQVAASRAGRSSVDRGPRSACYPRRVCVGARRPPGS